MPPQHWSKQCRKAGWIRLLSGLTSEPSTRSRGVAAWTESLADFLVSPSVWLEKCAESTTNVTSGPPSATSSPSSSPTGASSRTSPLSCQVEDTQSLESYKRWVSGLRRHCGQRRKLALRTSESASSSSASVTFPTPTASAYGTSQNGQRADGTTFKQAGKPSLQHMARTGLWPTPTASMATHGGLITPSKARHGGTLTEELSARLWPTPKASDYKRNGGPGDRARDSPDLPARVKMEEERALWATPTVEGNYASASQSRDAGRSKGGDGLATQAGGRLNPTWVEWLMGLPMEWTACVPSATPSFPSKPRRRSKSSTGR